MFYYHFVGALEEPLTEMEFAELHGKMREQIIRRGLKPMGSFKTQEPPPRTRFSRKLLADVLIKRSTLFDD